MNASSVRKGFGWSLLLLLISGADSQAQHKPAAPRGTANPPGGGNGQQIPAHIQQQIQREYEAAMRREQEMMMRMQQEQFAAYQRQMAAQLAQHQQRMEQFQSYLRSNGGESQGKSSPGNLAASPDELKKWANAQRANKNAKKSYDPLYDQYLSFEEANRASQKSNSSGAKPRGKAARQDSSSTKGGANPATSTSSETTSPKTAPSAKDERAAVAKAEPKGASGTTGAAPKGSSTITRPAKPTPAIHDKADVELMTIVHRKLREADHDYDGHRVESMHHIVQAIHHLNGSTGLDDGLMREYGGKTQAESDAILRDGVTRLRTIERSLAAKGGAQQYSEAHAAVGQAIRQLQIALKIR